MDYDQVIICKFFGYPRSCIRGSTCRYLHVTPNAANMNLWTKRTTEISQNQTVPSSQAIGASQGIAPQMMGASHGETLQVMGASHDTAPPMTSNSHEVAPPSTGIHHRESPPTIGESVQEKKHKRPRPSKKLRERKRKRKTAQQAEQQAAIFSNRINTQSTSILRGTAPRMITNPGEAAPPATSTSHGANPPAMSVSNGINLQDGRPSRVCSSNE